MLLRHEKKLNKHIAMVIFDTFKGQTVEEVTSLLTQNNILHIIVPSNSTDHHLGEVSSLGI